MLESVTTLYRNPKFKPEHPVSQQLSWISFIDAYKSHITTHWSFKDWDKFDGLLIQFASAAYVPDADNLSVVPKIHCAAIAFNISWDVPTLFFNPQWSLSIAKRSIETSFNSPGNKHLETTSVVMFFWGMQGRTQFSSIPILFSKFSIAAFINITLFCIPHISFAK